MNRIAAVFVLLTAAAGCASKMPMPPAEPIDDTQIVPYSRIGKLALGMTEAQLLKWMGEPEKTLRLSATDNFYYYDGGRLHVRFENGRADYVATLNSRYASNDGISVGASDLRMRAVWGSPTRTRSLGPCGDTCDTIKVQTYQYCFKNGLQVDVDAETGKVALIGVRVEGCDLP